jgi:hypothetical protein
MRHYTSKAHYNSFKSGQNTEMPTLCGQKVSGDGGPSGHGVNCPTCINKNRENQSKGWKR